MSIVLDTNAVLYFLAGRLSEPLPQADFYVSVITEIELLSYPLINREYEIEIRDFLNDVTIINLTEKIKQSAIAFRRQYRLKLPDALIVATAYNLNAELFTNHIKLLNLSELSIKSLSLKAE
ncbi:MAG: type II toxin-antitoxin system VapC family toxin [Methylococcales bacterium]|nr:type II toxin-antitoxin system VapC family toxin [Methylococcales bacterium]